MPIGEALQSPMTKGWPSGSSEGTRLIRHRPLWFVAVISFVSFGFYLPVWVANVRREMLRAAGRAESGTWWYGLSVAVPVYGLWRLHGHVTEINRLLEESQCTVRTNARVVVISEALAMLMFFPANVLATIALVSLGVRSPAAYIGAPYVLSFVFVAFTVTYVQSGLNRCWRKILPQRVVAGVRMGEWAAMLALAILWISLVNTFVRG